MTRYALVPVEPTEAHIDRVAAAIFDAVWEATGRAWPRWADADAPDRGKDEARLAARAALAADRAAAPPITDADVERVAKAIAPACWDVRGRIGWDNTAQESRRKASLKHARAAIAALLDAPE